MIYPRNFENKIGFDLLREYLSKKCLSKLGSEQVANMKFSFNKNEVISRLNETVAFISILNSDSEFPEISIYEDLSSLLRIRVEGNYLNNSDLHNLRRALCAFNDISIFFSRAKEAELYENLQNLVADLCTFPEIIRIIDNVLDKFGNVKDNASAELYAMRKSINSISSSINGTLHGILTRCQKDGLIEKDVTPAIRDGRLVIPVPQMYKRIIKGIIHDESATGRTIYIEPAEIVEANNNIRELEIGIKKEIIKILSQVSADIRPHIDSIIESMHTMAFLDFTRAKALAAIDLNCNMPNVSNNQEIELYNAVHPVLQLSFREQKKSVVPLNLTLNRKNRILIISGPNAGGKSVCLKTIGIIQYMFQCGMLPSVYSNSHMSIFKNIFIDIGDEQSMENDLSTYSSHLNNMKYFLAYGNKSTLLLIDEFGGGTEPQIGGAIAQSILSYLNEKKTFGIITTHYQNLKHYAEDTDGIVNGAMLYDRAAMKPLFQLSIGYPGSSFAIEIARKIGLPQEVINDAKEIVGSDYVNMDKYLLDIARDRKYWENKRQDIKVKEKRLSSLMEKYDDEIESINKERRIIIKDAKKEAKNILDNSNSIIEKTVHDIKVAQAEKERTKELRAQLNDLKARILKEESDDNEVKNKFIDDKKNKKRKKVINDKTEEEILLNVGDNVQIKDSTTVGEIISIDGDKAVVAFGNLKTTIKLTKLVKTIKKASVNSDSESMNNASRAEIRKRQLNFSPDLDVRGFFADEAIQAVTYFIDDAFQFDIKRVRILHGTGNGILRQRIREYLNTISGVKSYKDEHVQFGGAGITVVDLN